jgi:aryl-alcohol dehydrogenase-like predicted oxidoreductase
MNKSSLSRRTFLQTTAAGVATASLAQARPAIFVGRRSAGPRESLKVNMQYRVLGKTGIRLSEVSMGGHNTGMEKKHAYYRGTKIVPEANSDLEEYAAYYRERTEQMACALDMGINFFDPTNDREVRSLATALKRLGRRNDCYICGDFLRGRYHDEKTPEELRESLIEHINKTIRVFDTDRVDLLRVTTFEKWNMEELAGGIDGFQFLKKEGKARFFGISSHDPEYIKKVLARFSEEIDFVVTPYSYSLRQAEEEIFPLCYEKGIGVITIKPFHGGSFFLSGSDAVQKGPLRKLTPPPETLQSLTKGASEGLVQANLHYILSSPFVTATIPGMNSCEEIIQNAQASGTVQANLLEERVLREHAGHSINALPERYRWLRKWKA